MSTSIKAAKLGAIVRLDAKIDSTMWIGEKRPPTDHGLDNQFKKDDPRRRKYIESQMKELEPIIKKLARQRLPLALLATQWESSLTHDKAYFGLPPDKNPNVIGVDGKVQARLCPFGPEAT